MNQAFTVLELGKECPLACPTGISILWDETGFLLTIKESRLTRKEVESFRNGKLKIDLVFENNVIFFIVTIPNFLDESDIAFTARISDLTVDKLPEIVEDKGFAFNMMLVEGSTNLITAMRVVGLTEDMSIKLRECMLKQLTSEFSMAQHIQDVISVQSKLTPIQMQSKAIASVQYK